MKKLLAITLALTFLLSLTACGKTTKKASVIKNSETIIETEENEILSNEIDDLSSNLQLDEIKNFDDFVNEMDKSGFKTTATKNDDGSITIDIKSTTTDDENVKPAIPTIDTLPQPKPTVEPDPEPQPEKPETDNETNNNDLEETPDISKPTPEPTPEPEPEPTPEPEVIPEPKPQKPQYTYTTNQKHTKLHYTKRYLYNLLNNEQKGWYKKIDTAITNLEEGAIFDSTIAEDRNYYIYYLYMFDNPEHFYLGKRLTISNLANGTTKFIFCYSDGEMTCSWGSELKRINDELRQRIRNKQAKFEKEVEKIISTIPANAPVVWKEKLIYDRILIDSYYNLSAKWDGIAEDNWTAYGILVNKYGVCESYAEAFQTLCLYVGINCTGVVGNAGGGHKWNCVQLDGEWYMCDVTWDDPIGGASGKAEYHTYFNITSARITELMHTWENSEFPVPECTATKYSYDNYFRN